MAWYNRPEGFVAKSLDTNAPSTEVANEIRVNGFRIGTLTITHMDCDGCGKPVRIKTDPRDLVIVLCGECNNPAIC